MTTDTSSRLLKTKEEKIANLSEKSFADNNLDYKSNTDMGDGYVENNNNKIWGISEDWTPQEKSFGKDYMNATFTLPNTSRRDRRLYEFGVKDEGEYVDPSQDFQPENYKPVKIGLASGRNDSSDPRYIPDGNGYGWESGTRGVDVAKKASDVNQDYTAATAWEALIHSNKNSIDNRVVRERSDGWYDYSAPSGMKVISKAEKDVMFGSGASEYYTSHDSVYDDNYDPAEVDQAKVIAGINKAMEIVRGNSTYVPKPDVNNYVTPTSSFGNSLAGFGAAFVGELLVNPADAVGDYTGLYQIGNEEQKDKMVNDAFGYDPEVVSHAMEKVGANWDILVDDKSSNANKMRAVGNSIIEVFVTPELFATSFGTVMAWASPGKFLKMLDVGTTYDKAARSIDLAVKAGTTTKQAGRAQKIEKFLSIDGAKSFLTSQSGMITSSAANVNDQYEQFVINNNGVELEGSEKAKFFAGRFTIQMLNQNLDKFTDFGIIKSTGIIASIVPAVKQMTSKEFSNLAKTMGKGSIKTLENMGKEAAQEYSQTMMELFNSRFGSEQFSDVDTFTSFITDERNTRESGIAALAGAGGSLQFEVAGQLRPTAVAAAGIAGSIITPAQNPDRGDIPDSTSAAEVAQAIQENIDQAGASTSLAEQYYAAQGSGDTETQATAKASVADEKAKVMNGSSAIFHSDEDFSVKLGKLRSIAEVVVAEDPEVSDKELLRAAVRGFKATREQLPEIEAAIAEGMRDGLEFARIKPMFEVSEELRNSPKGFVTYYAKAKAALAQGDIEAYTTNIRHLDRFYTHQTNKLANLNTGIDDVRGTIEAEVEVLMKNEATIDSRKKALIHLKRKYQEDGKNKTLEVFHSDAHNSASTKVGYKDVVRKMIDPTYTSGIFSITGDITSATTQMEEVYNSLIAKESGEAVVDEVAPASDLEVAASDEVVPTTEEDASSELTPEEIDILLDIDAQDVDEEGTGNEPFSDEEAERIDAYYENMSNPDDYGDESGTAEEVVEDATQEPVAEEPTAAEPVQEDAYVLKIGTKSVKKGTPLTGKTTKELKSTRTALKTRRTKIVNSGTTSGKGYDAITADIDAITQYLDAETSKVPDVVETTSSTDTINEPASVPETDSSSSTPSFNDPDSYYRVIVGDEAFADIVESGLVRTNSASKNKPEDAGKINIMDRPTLFPSFSKGAASMSYAGANPNNYIIVSQDESIKPSTSGRHGKGKTMFPTDENGNHLESLSGEAVDIYKHDGDGEYTLVYSAGKLVIAPDVEEEFSIPPAPEDVTEGLSIPEEQDFDVNEMPPADTNTSEEDDYLMSNEDDLSMPPNDGYDSDIVEDYEDVISDEVEQDTFSDYEEYGGTPKTKRVKKDSLVSPFIANKEALKVNKKEVKQRRTELRAQGIKGEAQLADPTLAALLEQQADLILEADEFPSSLIGTVAARFGDNLIPEKFKTAAFNLFTHFRGGNSNQPEKYTTTVATLFGSLLPTGFTVLSRSMEDLHESTKVFADRLTKNLGSAVPSTRTRFVDAIPNPALFLLRTSEGEFNPNALEAMHAATTEFLVREASNLLGDARTVQDVAEMFNISEDQVTPALHEELSSGGIHLKFAADAIGALAYKNLGLDITSIQEKEAMVTYLGLTALQGISGEFVRQFDLSPEAASTLKGTKIVMIKGTHDILSTDGEPGKLGLFSSLKAIVATNLNFEDELGVEIDKERTYRTSPTVGNRKITTHRSEYQNAPVDQEEAVNRMEKTPFLFNDGAGVLLEVFSDSNGALDVKALVEHELGPDKDATNEDAKQVLKARKASLTRSLTHYKEANEERGALEMFFDWFIAKNHRLHLDSNRINPQSDKILARWLLTTGNSRFDIDKKAIDDVLDSANPVTMEAVSFAYSIVQAFDGSDGAPDISKNNEDEIVAYAKVLLRETSESELVTMMKSSQHVGHAALAIANIRKYNDKSKMFTSDMVLEVDGLTNGFAFRIMQFPLATGSITATEWLEKVGFITEDNTELFKMGSMNEAGDNGMKDVYITVGGMLGGKIVANTSKMKPSNKPWIKLFQDHKKLPSFKVDLDEKEQKDFDGFVRNLVKSPVMIFNYAAGAGKISSGMVNDQIMGQSYMKGKGLLDLLTAVDDKGRYIVSEQELKNTFPKDGNGSRYHRARVALKNKSIFTKDNADILALKESLYGAIGQLYSDPIEETLTELFGRQTEINTAIIAASTFMYQHFEDQYSAWRDANPDATEEDKMEFLKDKASIIPGVKGANTDDQRTKITFLKNVLEQTNNAVEIQLAGNVPPLSTNTVSRGFGDPGVGPAVLTVLSLDSSALSRAINGFYKKRSGESALTVHDALIIGIGESGLTRQYSKDFYFTNRSYSISQEFVNAMNDFEAMIGPSVDLMTIPNSKDEPISYRAVKDTLVTLNNEVQSARDGIFSKVAKVGQMVGTRGTMADIDPVKLKEEAEKGMSGVAAVILKEFGSAQLKATLGKDHAVNLKKLKSMLEGCM